MARLPSNLPTLLRNAGLTVVELDGWQTRGRPPETGGFEPVGVLNHHTGASAKGWSLAQEKSYAEWMAKVGRSDLPPPLVQTSLGRSGTVYLCAAGRSNHAGTAKPSGTVGGGDGNTLYIGCEWMLSGTEKIPAEMMAAGVTLNAVLTHEVTKTSVNTISCHYQTSVTGKWDIGDPYGIRLGDKKVLDVDKFRVKVAAERVRLYDTPAPAPVSKIFGLSWNLKTGRPPSTVRKELSSLIRHNAKPPFVSLQEGRTYRLAITLMARALGYVPFQPKDDGPKAKGIKTRESGSTVLMVRKDIKVRTSGALRGTKAWAGPLHQGNIHEGRVLPWAVILLDGVWTLVIATHMPTGRTTTAMNRAAWDETWAQIHDLVVSKGHPFILIGDWNDPWMNVGPRSIQALAKALGGAVVHTDAPIDYAVVGGHKTVVTKAGERGSDHYAIRIKKG